MIGKGWAEGRLFPIGYSVKASLRKSYLMRNKGGWEQPAQRLCIRKKLGVLQEQTGSSVAEQRGRILQDNDACSCSLDYLPFFLEICWKFWGLSYAPPPCWTCPDWASPSDYCVPRPRHPLHLETGTLKVAVMHCLLRLSNFFLVILLALFNLILSLKHLMFLMCPSQKLDTGNHKCCKNSLGF